jgi:hypothetical protein
MEKNDTRELAKDNNSGGHNHYPEFNPTSNHQDNVPGFKVVGQAPVANQPNFDYPTEEEAPKKPKKDYSISGWIKWLMEKVDEESCGESSESDDSSSDSEISEHHKKEVKKLKKKLKAEKKKFKKELKKMKKEQKKMKKENKREIKNLKRQMYCQSRGSTNVVVNNIRVNSNRPRVPRTQFEEDMRTMAQAREVSYELQEATGIPSIAPLINAFEAFYVVASGWSYVKSFFWSPPRDEE